ncbi:PPE domain-containing protein [Nocardia panacis]|uniref:PPE domain-containing protein n=1 Tax=Nocardia panacis TaxID=2340916 RepID=A0A3A4KDZ4_9NOCA|nr:PPE domain-containing protein [Nocardia panacis]RJO72101.1 PPE domain-containing protein [Nocardia panacis]
MIEPPQPGFTGVVWEAREPDRMTRELALGPGVAPMAEAGVTWAKLAAAFGTAVLDYDRIVASLHGAWESGSSGEVLHRVSKLREWLTDAAAAAAQNAVHAEKQAAAYQLARLTMPSELDVAAIKQAQQALEAMTAGLGAPIKAIAAQADSDADVAKAAASRIMRTYEAATEPLAVPWQQEQPPVIASGEPLAAEQAGAQAAVRPTATVPAGMSGGVLLTGLRGVGGVAAQRKLGAYRAPVAAEAVAAEEALAAHPIPELTPTTAATSASGAPMAPLGAAAAAGQQEQTYQSRAAASGDAIGADLGIVSAPAVLGAAETAAPTTAPQPAAPAPNQATTGGVA